jgi:hypothetical protein
MMDPRLLFLLRQELQLWHRSPHGLPALWTSIVFVIGLSLLCFLPTWIQGGFKVGHLSADSPPDFAVWFAGGLFWYIVALALIINLFAIIFPNRRFIVDQHARSWFHSAPFPSQIKFASTILSPIAISSITGHVFLFAYSIPLSIYFQSLRLFFGIHLSVTVWGIVLFTLAFWSRYASLKWGNHLLRKTLKISCTLSFLGISLPFVIQSLGFTNSFLSLDKIFQIFIDQSKRGQIFGSDSWLWIPSKVVFSDPLISVIWVLVAMGITWVTIEVLHRPLSFDHQSSSSPQKQAITEVMPPKAFQGNLAFLLMMREWKRMKSFRGFMSLLIILVSYIVLFNISRKDPLGNAINVSLLGVMMPALATWLLTHYGFAEDPMQLLLRTSPINITKAKTYKGLAALIPVWISLLTYIIVAGVLNKPWVLIATLGLAATLSHTFLRAWNACSIRPIEAIDIASDISSLGCRDLLLTKIESLSFFFWFIIPLLFLSGQSLGGMFFLCFEGFILFCAYRRNQKLGDSWST